MTTSLLNGVMVRGVAAAFMLCAARLAFAHAYPTAQTPSAGQIELASPKKVAIDFDDRLEPAFSSISVSDANGKAVTTSKAVVEPPNNKRMSVILLPLASGSYTVAWVAVAADGHRSQGRYTFTVK
jgi:methionine-rich copper-binding protein CopC